MFLRSRRTVGKIMIFAMVLRLSVEADVGAIGVSGGSGKDDHSVAEAAVAATIPCGRIWPDCCWVLVQRFGGGLAGACPLIAGEDVLSGATSNPGSMRASDPNLW
jgi:Haem-degrading